jgi:hypothetical protein
MEQIPTDKPKKPRGKPVSLFPLETKEALAALLAIRPKPRKKKAIKGEK